MPCPTPAPPRPPAPLVEELRLIVAWQDTKDRDALQLLITRQMPRLRSLGRRAGDRGREDLVAEGIIALIDAASRYPRDSGIPFTAYAMPAIRGAMLRSLAGMGSIVSIPERQLRDALSGRMEEARAEPIRQAMRAEEFDEVALGLSGPTAEEETLLRERRRQMRRAVARALRPLGREERRLVIRHLLHEDTALEDLADRLNLSPARARSLEGRALHKMRNTLINKGFLMSDLG